MNGFTNDVITNCSTGGPAFITNILATVQTNGLMTVTFEIYGTNGVFYDIFSTPNLLNTMASNQWNWIGEGLACNSYTFSNQPAGAAFYLLEIPAETFTIAFDGDNSYGQLNVPLDLSNAVAVAAGAYFNIALRNNGTVIGWGDNTYNQTNIPAGLSNVVGIAAGYYHGAAVLANGSVTNWGFYFGAYDGTDYYASVTNRAVCSAPPTSNVVAVAAGQGQDLALMSNGTVVAWGFTNVDDEGPAYGTQVPAGLNLTNVAAIACGYQFNLALSSNGTITAWGYNDPFFGYPTNVPSDLITNAVAIAAGGNNGLALRKNGTVEGWGDTNSGVTIVPTGLSNVVAVATGGESGLALQENGNIVIWGDSTLTNIPAGIAGVKAISSGFDHNIVVESGILTPVIFTQPADQYAPAGSNVTFSVQGAGVAGVTYQWQSNGVNLTGQTGASLTLTNVGASSQASYDVVVTTDGVSITSDVATFTLVVAPQIGSILPTNTTATWFNGQTSLSVNVTNAGQSLYPIAYGWQINGTNLSDTSSYYTIVPSGLTNDGVFSVAITNIVGVTNQSWNMLRATPGMAEAWGSDGSGECNRPVTATNVSAIAAGEYQSIAVGDTGLVYQWGQYSDGTHFYAVTNSVNATQPPTGGVAAVAAGQGHALALLTNGTVAAWGMNDSPAATIPAGRTLTNIAAIACGYNFNLVLSNNGTIFAWGDNTWGQTNIPASYRTNIAAIAAAGTHALAMESNGTVLYWGYSQTSATNPPNSLLLTNTVAVTCGLNHDMALLSNGNVVAWGNNTYSQTNVPASVNGSAMAIAAGDNHSVALLNNGTLVEWGNNSSGQATLPYAPITTSIVTSGSPPTFETVTNPPIIVKLIAAGGNHTMAGIWSTLVQYPINVSKDLLLIYNTSSPGNGSSNVCAYYRANRPMVSKANVLGIACETNEGISWSSYTSTFVAPIVTWLSNNPTLRPQYVVMFQDFPSRYTNFNGATASIHYDMNAGDTSIFTITNYLPSWTPFVTSINMNGTGWTNDCIQYINKLTNVAKLVSFNQPLLSPSPFTYGNTNWYFDWGDNSTDPVGASWGSAGLEAKQGVTNVLPAASVFGSYFPNYVTAGTNVAGYFSVGVDGYHTQGMATNGEVVWSGNSGWYPMASVDSYNGQRTGHGFQSGFLTWFAANAFAGTNANSFNYSNTPIGAISHVDEPYLLHENISTYYGGWAAGKSFAISAWAALEGNGAVEVQVTGDPFTKN